MKRASPPEPAQGEGQAFGRATRFTTASGLDLVRLPAEDAEQARELCAMGDKHLGPFLSGGLDGEGVWLLAVSSDETLGASFKRSRAPAEWRSAVRLALDLAEALALAEARALAPGALSPDTVLLHHGRAYFAGDALLERTLGVRARPTGSLSPVWCPPDQADGAPFDDAANRYVLGLLLYKLLTGSHPFSGAGLRRALEAARTTEAPPFPADVAEGLPPGLQSLTLKLLHPDLSKRPPNADAIADALSQLGGQGKGGLALGALDPRGARPSKPQATVPEEPAPAPVEQRAERPKRPPSSFVRTLLPIALGAAVAAAFVTQLSAPKVDKAPSYDVSEVPALAPQDTEAGDCQSCHARQVSEWRRSVMGHAVKSPLFNALESLIQEQVGRDFDCPNGAGILRKTNNQVACRDRNTGLVVSGSGGEHWCVNCHSPTENLDNKMPVWQGRAGGDPRSLLPVKDILASRGMEGISCGFCHQVHGPVSPRSRGYQGNPTWTSFVTGAVFQARPEDRFGQFGIANSGYDLSPSSFLLGGSGGGETKPGVPHKLHDDAQTKYLRSSEFCGSCHDVRLFGSDVIGAQKGEHFKRLRNGYTEWVEYSSAMKRRGQSPPSCQDCHMSTFPGVCVEDAGGAGDPSCPPGTKLEKRAPGQYAQGRVVPGVKETGPLMSHYLSGVDLPLAKDYPEDLLDEGALDVDGAPISAKKRRDLLLRAAFDFQLKEPLLRGDRLSIPVQIENVGAGHRVPAGFSQEREIWVELTVTDNAGRIVYQVGKVNRNDEDLRDKVFQFVNTDPSRVDNFGRPVGMFGADVRDGPDVPQWSPPPDLGGTRFFGKGLINFQNGFLRCVRCIGVIAPDGSCQPGPGQGVTRADRFVDGDYDIDTGECRSNLSGQKALFETFFPVGSLDSSRGLPKAPDAIIDTRSLPPLVPITYTYDLDLGRARGPFKIKARLLFRAFPPFLIRAFADYERQMVRLGKRPSGPLIDEGVLKRIEVVEVAKGERTVKP